MSFDATRELYEELNGEFEAEYERTTGQPVRVTQSHGGSGKQARAVIDGLDADVVSLALAHDIDAISERAGLLPADWAQRHPHHSAPFASTVVWVVRRGNPKGLRDWADLARPGVQVITANPKTSGGARWNYLAAWGAQLTEAPGDEAQARRVVGGIFRNAPVLPASARAATTTFVERDMGDVLLAWESDALLVMRGAHVGELERLSPGVSILAELPVAVVDANVDRKGTRAAAEAYVTFLFSKRAAALALKHGFRPNPGGTLSEPFAQSTLFRLEEHFGNWGQAQRIHFAAHGVLDALLEPAP